MHFIILEVITDQCSAFDLIKKTEVLAAGIEVGFFFHWTTGLIARITVIYNKNTVSKFSDD